jgi:hypothetical protein
MIDLDLLLFVQTGPTIVNIMYTEIIGWTTAITNYVLEFVRQIFPLFIYVAVFQIILRKS